MMENFAKGFDEATEEPGDYLPPEIETELRQGIDMSWSNLHDAFDDYMNAMAKRYFCLGLAYAYGRKEE